MYYIEICCICLNSRASLSLLQSDNLSLLHKLTYCVPELHFETNNTPALRYICLKCSEQLETAFVFKTMCIRNQHVVEGYLSKLQSVGELTAEQNASPRVALNRVENKILTPAENTQVLELKCEVSDEGEEESFLEDTAADAESTGVDEEARACDIQERSAKTEKEDNSDVIPIQNKDEPYYDLHKKKIDQKENTQVIELKCEVPDDDEGESFLEDTTADDESVNEEVRACNAQEKSVKTEKEDNSEVIPIQTKIEPYYDVQEKINDKRDSEQETISEENALKKKTKKDIHELSTTPKDSLTDEGVKQYTCDICRNSFSHIRNLKVHKRRHNGPPKYICDVCGKAFIGSSDLTKHRRIHSGEKPHKCDVCGKSYGRTDSLKKHKEMHTKPQKFICDICGKSYTQPGYLKVHLMLHTGERRHKCNICDKTFLLSSHLRSHRRIHTGEKPHTCEVCSESFMYLRQLKLHRKVHTGEEDERKFKCIHCEKAFYNIGHLQAHTRTHTGEKPFKCDTCGSQFSCKSHVTRHIKLIHTSERKPKIRILQEHTGERSFKCDTCGSQFTCESHLTRHIKLVHTSETKPKRSFKCDTCGGTFTLKKNLNRHIKLVHNSDRKPKIRVAKRQKSGIKSKVNSNVLTENTADQS